jgi:hypothetical protein
MGSSFYRPVVAVVGWSWVLAEPYMVVGILRVNSKGKTAVVAGTIY